MDMKVVNASVDFEAIKAPFPAEDIEWRVSRAGSNNGNIYAFVLAYVTNRAIMNRLDKVCGAENWKNEYRDLPNNGVSCILYIRVNGEWIGKEDAAENTKVESVKGGRSDAMKRAAVQWGIGRYLYNLTEMFANISPNGKHFQSAKQGKYESFKWDAPQLPTWALPRDFDRVEAINKLETLMRNMDFAEEHKDRLREKFIETGDREYYSTLYAGIKKGIV